MTATRARLRRHNGEIEEAEDAVRALQLLACATAAVDRPEMLLLDSVPPLSLVNRRRGSSFSFLALDAEIAWPTTRHRANAELFFHPDGIYTHFRDMLWIGNADGFRPDETEHMSCVFFHVNSTYTVFMS